MTRDEPRDRDGRDDEERLPPGLSDLDSTLRQVRFEPRRGLEAEVLDRVSRTRRAGRAPGAHVASGSARQRAVAAAILAAITLLGVLDGADVRERAPVADARGPAGGTRPTAGWAVRWGPDARVVEVGTSLSAEAALGSREIRCDRVDGRLRCRAEGSVRLRDRGTGRPAAIRDLCCADYDGGGRSDDGVRVVAGSGEAVVDFWLYEDRDGSRSFTPGDLLRTVVPSVPRPDPSGPAGLPRLDRCCADLDGGPREDDGVLVLTGAGERVALAMLYEDRTADGRLSRGDRLRAVRYEGREDRPGADAGR